MLFGCVPVKYALAGSSAHSCVCFSNLCLSTGPKAYNIPNPSTFYNSACHKAIKFIPGPENGLAVSLQAVPRPAAAAPVPVPEPVPIAERAAEEPAAEEPEAEDSAGVTEVHKQLVDVPGRNLSSELAEVLAKFAIDRKGAFATELHSWLDANAPQWQEDDGDDLPASAPKRAAEAHPRVGSYSLKDRDTFKKRHDAVTEFLIRTVSRQDATPAQKSWDLARHLHRWCQNSPDLIHAVRPST